MPKLTKNNHSLNLKLAKIKKNKKKKETLPKICAAAVSVTAKMRRTGPTHAVVASQLSAD